MPRFVTIYDIREMFPKGPMLERACTAIGVNHKVSARELWRTVTSSLGAELSAKAQSLRDDAAAVEKRIESLRAELAKIEETAVALDRQAAEFLAVGAEYQKPHKIDN